MSMSLGKCFFMIEKDDYRKIINRKQKGQTIWNEHARQLF